MSSRLLLVLAAAALSADGVRSDPSDLNPDQPVIPGQFFNLKDFGAVGDGVTSNTSAFAHAMAAVNLGGGGELLVPAGTYLTGAIDLCNGINLHLDPGATIRFLAKEEEYPIDGLKPHALVLGRSLHDVLISGTGTFDGQGQAWWVAARAHRDLASGRPLSGALARPNLISFIQCQRVRVEEVSLRNSPMYNLTITSGSDTTVDGISILNPPDSPNTDGIDPKGAQRVLITRCRIDTGDDCIALGGNNLSVEEDILVTDCTFLHGHGCSIGSGTEGGVRDVKVRRCTFDGTDTGVRLKSSRTRGGLTENLVYEDLTMKNVGHAISLNSHYAGTTTDVSGLGHTDPAIVTFTTPIWRHIVIRNLRATGGTEDAGLIVGLPEMLAEDITLEHVTIEAPKGLLIAYARNITLNDVHIKPAAGAAVITGEMVEGLVQ